jgi:hypothetical protein
MSEFPQDMYVGNNIVNGSPYGGAPVTIVKYEDGRYFDARGYSWKYALSVVEHEKQWKQMQDEYLAQVQLDEQRELFEYTRNINHDC